MDVTATHRAEIAPVSLSEDWKRSRPGEKPEQHADSSACPCPRWGKCVGSALGSRLSPGQHCSRGLTCKASPPGGSLLLPTSHLQLGFLFPLPGVSQSSVGLHTQVCSGGQTQAPPTTCRPHYNSKASTLRSSLSRWQGGRGWVLTEDASDAMHHSADLLPGSFGKCVSWGLSCAELSAWNHFLEFSRIFMRFFRLLRKAIHPEQSNACA